MDFTDFIGQTNCKENLQLLISAAKRGRKFPHIGLYGPAGSGKTTLASIICEELDAELIYINGAAVTSAVVFRKPIAKAVQLNGKDKQYIIVIDECHCLPSKVQNNLLSVTEEPAILCTPVERKTKLPNGTFLQKGDILQEKLPDNVSFIFATTDKGKINGPLSSRLHPIDLDEYTAEDKEQVVKNLINKNNTTLEDESYILIGSIGKSMRHINKLCDRIIDYAVANDCMVLKHEDIVKIIKILGINELGCDKNDQKYLDYVKGHGPVSLSNIARFLNVEEKEVREKIEPFLIRKEWIEITSKGRVVTDSGYKTLWGEVNPDTVEDLMSFVMSD